MINLLRPWFIAILYCAGLCFTAPCSAAHLAMGFRVGEVKQTSVLIWSRVTATPERNWKGYRDPKKREPRVAEYTPSPIAVSDRQGNVEGAAGEIRVTFGTKENQMGLMLGAFLLYFWAPGSLGTKPAMRLKPL